MLIRYFALVFFLLNFQNPLCIIFSQHISVQTSHISSAQQLLVAHGYCTGRVLDHHGCHSYNFHILSPGLSHPSCSKPSLSHWGFPVLLPSWGWSPQYWSPILSLSLQQLLPSALKYAQVSLILERSIDAFLPSCYRVQAEFPVPVSCYLWVLVPPNSVA